MNSKPMRPPSAKVFRVLYALGLGPLVGRLVLLITTKGRKTGLPRVTALQYEKVDRTYYLGSSKGLKADWVKNIQADPCVKIQVKNRRFQGYGEVVNDPQRIANYLELRLHRHPQMMKMILSADGLPAEPSHDDLKEYAKKLALIIIHEG